MTVTPKDDIVEIIFCEDAVENAVYCCDKLDLI
jgi:hypothetical protein